MSLRDSQFGELKVPLTWTAAVALVVAAIVAIALVVSDRRETFRAEAYGATRSMSDGVLAPVGDVLSAPGRWTGAGVQSIGGYFFAVSENRRLKAELKEMRQWRDVATALKDENERYRTLLGLKTDPPIPMVAARIVTDSRGPFANTRLANAGREKGVKVGHPVMSENGLVGRVIGISNGASRVLMLTDVASRTPVMIDRTNARAILTGDGGPNPRLEYLRGQDPVKEGDRVLTSGDGGVMPRGLPVGVVVKGLDNKWRVVLAADRAAIDFVRILLFDDFTTIVNRAELDQMPVPPPTPGAPTIIAPTVVGPTAAQPGTAPGAVPPAAAGSAAPAAGAATPAPRPPAAAGAQPAPRTAAPAPTRPAAGAASGSAATARPAAPRPAATTSGAPRPAASRPPAASTGAAARPATPRPAAAPAEEPPH
ncbi:rod shape-determining protein MreC [Phenylobacterium deserti]|uniref:Cell shape-determining protein MreC n=1 Tax=Phenylobacterium deserti TaxID=1914756 RepID=A0A328A9P7_9CAUL|nr:rod shape-determining protein MreC [Phenylobacterium deserti]RAK51245.1 rod shape-determining protein MreC [Phenylobacterium deserti]